MDSLLGFSAFHLRATRPIDNGMSEISHKYMIRAITGHAEDIRRGIRGRNAEVVFATSTLIAFHCSMSRKFLNLGDGPPLHWFRPYQGIRAILDAGWESLSQCDVHHFIKDEMAPLYILTTGVPPTFDFLLEGLVEEPHDAETIECYESAVSYLSWIYNSPFYRHVLRFAAMTGPEFLRLLSDKDPRILTIAGYFFMLLRKVDVVWVRQILPLFSHCVHLKIQKHCFGGMRHPFWGRYW